MRQIRMKKPDIKKKKRSNVTEYQNFSPLPLCTHNPRCSGGRSRDFYEWRCSNRIHEVPRYLG